MSVYFFAYVEAQIEDIWQLAHPLTDQEPTDIAPAWGWDAIDNYMELSAEKGLPPDISDELQAHIVTEWAGETYRASWLTLAEVEQLCADPAYADRDHLNVDWLENDLCSDPHAIRVVFWHD